MELIRPVRLVIVGCGAITDGGHLPAALRSPHVDVAALVDVNLANAKALAARYGIKCPVADRLDAVLDRAEGVVIATPNHTHAAIAATALQRGLPTLIEKPITTTYEDAIRLCDLADKNGAFVAVAYRSRFWPAVLLLKHLLTTDYLGRIQSFQYAVGTRSTWSPVSGFNVSRQMAGGGILIDSHVIDKTLYWFGEPVSFTYSDDSHGGVEATCKATMLFESPGGSFTGSLLLSRTMDLENALVIRTDKYRCELGESPTARVSLRPNDRPDIELQPRCAVGASATDGGGDFQRQLEEFANNIRARGNITIDGRFAAKSIRLIEAMYQNRSQLGEPWMRRSSEMERATV